MSDDDDLRRKELFRLLETASTTERRTIVQKAIDGLDTNTGHSPVQLDEPFIPETVGIYIFF